MARRVDTGGHRSPTRDAHLDYELHLERSTLVEEAADEGPGGDAALAGGSAPKKARTARAADDAAYTLPVDSPHCAPLDALVKLEAARLALLPEPAALRAAVQALLSQPVPLPPPAVAPPPLLFVRMVLARLPPARLAELDGPASSALATGEVRVEALLREHTHHCRQLASSFLTSRLPSASPAQRAEPMHLLSAALTPAFLPSGDLSPALRTVALTPDERSHLLLPAASPPPPPGRRAGVPCVDLYRLALDVFTGGCLRRLDWSAVALVGSAALAPLLPVPRPALLAYVALCRTRRALARLPLPGDVVRLVAALADVERPVRAALAAAYGAASAWGTADVDLLVLADSPADGAARLQRTYEQLVAALPPGVPHAVVRTANALNVALGPGRRTVQLLLGVGLSPADFALYCDLDANQCAFDGAQPRLLPRALRALVTRTNLAPPSALRNRVARARLLKYAARGFAALLFEPCKHAPRCDVRLSPDLLRLVDTLRAGNSRVPAPAPRDPNDDALPGAAAAAAATAAQPDYDDAALPSGAALDVLCQYARESGLQFTPPACTPVPLAVLLQPTTPTARGVRFRLHDVLLSPRGSALLLKCYQCGQRAPYDPAHPELAGLRVCGACTALNTAKLTQWDQVDGAGRVALVTGARIKIGYQVGLRLLRSGFTLVAVTRFPRDAARRYAAEADFAVWRERLDVCGVDLRHVPLVAAFTAAVARRYSRLDVLVNNAAQTVRRPRAYYRALVDQEAAPAPPGLHVAALLARSSFLPAAATAATLPPPFSPQTALAAATPPATALIPPYAQGAPLSAALTQVPLLACDAAERDDELFPPQRVDAHGEPLDLRRATSWSARLGELSAAEALEVSVVNATVPLLLVQSLAPLLAAAAPAFVVHASAPEGQFTSAQSATGAHVHTCMAKAALNMSVRALAPQLAHQRVFLSAVDTGWVTDMRPHPAAAADADAATDADALWRSAPAPPLTELDAAARVLDPVAQGLLGRAPPYGVLLRNYRPVPW